MRHAAAAPSSIDRHPTRSPARRVAAGVIVGALVLAACGGGDDDEADTDDSTTTTTTPSLTPVSSVATTTTSPTTSTTTLPPVEYVTDGATVVVANASGVDGAAGRMTNQLESVGFSTGTATNSSEGQLNTSKVYYAADDEAARAVADSVREGLGGGDIEVLELPTPAPTDAGEIGDATVLVAMGNDTADQSLDELQGRVASDDTGDDDSGDDTGDEATDDGGTGDDTADEATGDEVTGDEVTGDGGTGDDTSDG